MIIVKEHYKVHGMVLFVQLMKINLRIDAESGSVHMTGFLAVKPVNCINLNGTNMCINTVDRI